MHALFGELTDFPGALNAASLVHPSSAAQPALKPMCELLIVLKKLTTFSYEV